MPFVFVVAVATFVFVPLMLNVPLAPAVGAVNVTVAFATGFWPPSTTRTDMGANGLPAIALCGVPLRVVIAVGVPARLVSVKFAGEATPATEAVTVSCPAIPFAENVVEAATPLAFVSTAVLLTLAPLGSAKVPLAPLAGAVKTTTALLTGLFPLSRTVTCNGVANGLLIPALCGVPPVALTAAGAPVVLLRSKVAGVWAPGAEAATE